MSMDALEALTWLASIGSGVMGGVFFAFSTFIMKALGRLAPAQGIRAMQSINVVVLNPAFLGVFLGTAVLCLLVAAQSLGGALSSRAAWSLAGCALYIAGIFGVTVLFNVPLNRQLALVDPQSPEGESRWSRYQVSWTTWNHVRTISGLASAASFSVALTR